MPVNDEAMSDRMFYALAHPSQTRRFYLALVFAIIVFPVIALALVAGTVVLIVPFFTFVIWLGARIFLARLIGNLILVSSVNYPRINTIAEELKIKMGYPKPIYIFVLEYGNFNAFLSHFFFRRAIFLPSELLEMGVSDDEVRWLVGRFIGYLRARRQAGVLGWVIRAAHYLVIFNIFLLPYERAMVYTGDRLAVAAINGDITSAISAMQKLLVGRQLGYSVNPEGMIEQQRQVKGSVFAFLARVLSGFPHMTSRYVDLIVFAKIYFPTQFIKFEAANPGLPDDLSRLATSPPLIFALPPGGIEAMGKRPHGWLWATGTAVFIVVICAVGWTAWTSRERDTLQVPPNAVAPNLSASVTPPAPAPTVPPHIHLNGQAQWVPDPGCHWFSNAANDLRAVCN